jgi:hypothetical protein
MSDHENARPPRAGARLSQRVDGPKATDPTYWATEHGNFKYVRPFEGKYYKVDPNEMNHTGAFLLPDGKSVVIINSNTPNKWHFPTSQNEKKMAAALIKQYNDKYKHPPSKHYEFRERLHKEGRWKKPGQPGFVPPPPAAAGPNHANHRAPQPQPVAQGQVYRPGPARPVPQNYVPAPAPQVNVWSQRGNQQQANHYERVWGSFVNSSANHAQAQLQQTAGFNKYVQFDVRTYRIIAHDTLIKACASHVNNLERDHEAWQEKGEALKKIKQSMGLQEGQPLKFKFELPVKLIEKLAEYKANFMSGKKEFEGKQYQYEFPAYLDLVSGMNVEAIRSGHKPLLEGTNFEVKRNIILKFVYEYVERLGTEHEKLVITDEAAPYLFGYAVNFYNFICRDLALLLVHHHDEMEKIKIQRSTAQAMDQKTGENSHGDLNAAAAAYQVQRMGEPESSTFLRSRPQQIEYLIFCMKNAELSVHFPVLRMIYELVRKGNIDYDYFKLFDQDRSIFAEALAKYKNQAYGNSERRNGGQTAIVRYFVNENGQFQLERYDE